MNKKIENRIKECINLEMYFNGESFIGKSNYNKDFNIHLTEINCNSDEKWNEIISDLTIELEKRKLN